MDFDPPEQASVESGRQGHSRQDGAVERHRQMDQEIRVMIAEAHARRAESRIGRRPRRWTGLTEIGGVGAGGAQSYASNHGDPVTVDVPRPTP